MGFCVLTYCFVTTFESQNNDLSYYHDQRLIRLPCVEKILKIYIMVVLEFEVKVRVAFLFAFSIFRGSLSSIFKIFIWAVSRCFHGRTICFATTHQTVFNTVIPILMHFFTCSSILHNETLATLRNDVIFSTVNHRIYCRKLSHLMRL